VTLRLGHITYSNCFPVHARLLDRPQPDDPVLVEGIPSLLNGLLERGEIDVAPCSSIEFARHADRYRILPDLVIGCRGPVRSILSLSSCSPDALDGRTVALPTASATSVVLLKILCRVRWKVSPRWVWFDQAREDPFARGADAALFIGDVALRPGLYAERQVRLDLGQEWWEQTGLPFAFAVWQAGGGTREELQALHTRLVESRRYGLEHLSRLAEKYATEFGLPATLLEQYWRDLRFELDEEMLEGLGTFYRCAAEIGELLEAPALRCVV
jgi:chorismate dehydratase